MNAQVEWFEREDGGLEVVVGLSPELAAEVTKDQQGWVALTLSAAAIRQVLVNNFPDAVTAIDLLIIAGDLLEEDAA